MTREPIAAFRQPLRRDPRGWQIEDDPMAEEALRAVETLGMIFAEMVLHRLSRAGLNPGDPDTDLALRAMGSVAGRVGMSRLAWQTGVDETGNPRRDSAGTPEAEAAGERMRAVLNWLFEWDLNDPDAPPKLRTPSTPPATVRLALEELWAALLYFDRRAKGQGVVGPGQRRRVTRETTRRTSS